MLLEEQKFIVEKAARLFKKYGIKSVSMDDIAKELGISKKTIYQSVKDKETLIGLFLDEEFRYYKNKLSEIENKSYNVILEFIKIDRIFNEFIFEISLPLHFDLVKYFPKIFSTFKDRYNQLFYETVKGNLEKGIKNNIYRKNININIISKHQLLRLDRVHESKVFSLKEISSSEFIKEICYYHLRGIIENSAINLLDNYKNEEINKIQSYEPSYD